MSVHKPVADRFKGRTAVVSGGVNGIGRATLDELLKEGANVAFSDLSPDGEALAADMKASGHEVLFLEGDMEDEGFCAEFVDAAAGRFGRIDYLVNNAFAFTAKALDAEAADWRRSYTVGPVGFARMIQNVRPHMVRSGGGAVVNVGSISGHIAQKCRWTYNMAKGAVDQLTKCAALDLAADGIRVNSISPGWIWTNEVHKAADMDGGGRAKWDPIWGKYHMLRRCGEPVECARAILFLLSDDASFITGADLPVDGGYLSMGPEGLGETAVVAGSD
ncbi:SDR family oxidoreductase [Oricola sp.]|uniref:SDR family oxidoreductase n=1 Tax=Oricola sp. TaxID=1979950 RepID=UPI003BA9B2C4